MSPFYSESMAIRAGDSSAVLIHTLESPARRTAALLLDYFHLRDIVIFCLNKSEDDFAIVCVVLTHSIDLSRQRSILRPHAGRRFRRAHCLVDVSRL